jgi:hypothetical protein
MAKSQADDPVEELKHALRSDNAPLVQRLVDRHPEV